MVGDPSITGARITTKIRPLRKLSTSSGRIMIISQNPLSCQLSKERSSSLVALGKSCSVAARRVLISASSLVTVWYCPLAMAARDWSELISSLGTKIAPLRSLIKLPLPMGIGAPCSVPTPRINSRLLSAVLSWDWISLKADLDTPSVINSRSARR